jgi:hypothetical protein
MKTKLNLNVIILISILGFYVLYLLHFFGVLKFKNTTKVKGFGSSILTGPYESCQDSICSECVKDGKVDFECKKKCMCDRYSDIVHCCVKSCPPDNTECLTSCFPTEDPC